MIHFLQQKKLIWAGRYCKYSRELSQSPWLFDGKRITETSVQELIAGPLNKHFQADGKQNIDCNSLDMLAFMWICLCNLMF